jgi:hypothetical protein
LLAQRVLMSLSFQRQEQHLLDEWDQLFVLLTIFCQNTNNWSILINMFNSIFNLQKSAVWIKSCSSSIVLSWL